MEGAYSMYEMYSRLWSENLVERRHLEDKGFVGWDMLK